MTISHERKKVIKDKIEKIKKKRYLIEIFKIINSDSSINKSENNNGIFLYFNNLKDGIYLKLERYLDIIENEDNVTETDFSTTFSETNSTNIIDEDYGTKLKLSNKEKNIIKKKQYDKILSENKIGLTSDEEHEPEYNSHDNKIKCSDKLHTPNYDKQLKKKVIKNNKKK